MEDANHHWEGLKPNPHGFFGFIYRIDVEETGKSYIGKRQYWTAKRIKGCKSKISDKGSPRWKPTCWKCSEWEHYSGSSKELSKYMALHPEYTYRFTIIKQCRSRGTLVYSEAEEQWKANVLTEKLPNGDYKYFNKSIAAMRFRPQIEKPKGTKGEMIETIT